jgi:hypothetical protein
MLRTFFTTVAAGSLFVGGLAATHLAFAQPGPDGGRGARGGMMAQADTNNDGKISKAELTAALDARFAKMDVDRDGQLTSKDRDLKRQQRLDERFATLDADRNGQISKAEFAAGHEARADKRAQAGKPDGRGWGKGHHRGPGRGMMRGGPGGFGPGAKDGVMTKAQFMAGPIAMFDKADTNKDGFVTADEMKAARQAMRAQWQDRKGPSPAPQD